MSEKIAIIKNVEISAKTISECLSRLYGGIDLKSKSRERKYAYARKVFCRLCVEMGFEQKEILKYFREYGRDLVTYHSKTFYIIKGIDLFVYNACIEEMNLPLRKYPNMRSLRFTEEVERMSYKLMSKLNKKELEFLDEYVINKYIKWKDKKSSYFVVNR